VHKTDNLTAIFEPTVEKIWESKELSLVKSTDYIRINNTVSIMLTIASHLCVCHPFPRKYHHINSAQN
jgi:hypothetical protein